MLEEWSPQSCRPLGGWDATVAGLREAGIRADVASVHRHLCHLRNLALGHVGGDGSIGYADGRAGLGAGAGRTLVDIIDEVLSASEVELGSCPCVQRAPAIAAAATDVFGGHLSAAVVAVARGRAGAPGSGRGARCGTLFTFCEPSPDRCRLR